MIYTKSIHVDMARQRLEDVIMLHEGDANGAQLQISLFNNGAAFDLTNYTVKYDAVIAGYLAENDAAADSSSNMITVPITANMCAKSGTLEIDVKILEGSGDNARVFFLQRFEARVQRRVINEDIIIDVSGTTIGEKIAALEAKFPVQTKDIARAAVNTEKIAPESVTTEKIADAAVTTDKIANDAITENKINQYAVSESKIRPGSVTLSKLAKEVENHFMNPAIDLEEGSTTENIKYGQVFRYDGRYYFKNSSSPTPFPNVGLANMNDILALGSRIDSLQNIVGNANSVLEAALHYQQ